MAWLHQHETLSAQTQHRRSCFWVRLAPLCVLGSDCYKHFIMCVSRILALPGILLLGIGLWGWHTYCCEHYEWIWTQVIYAHIHTHTRRAHLIQCRRPIPSCKTSVSKARRDVCGTEIKWFLCRLRCQKRLIKVWKVIHVMQFILELEHERWFRVTITGWM